MSTILKPCLKDITEKNDILQWSSDKVAQKVIDCLTERKIEGAFTMGRLVYDRIEGLKKVQVRFKKE